MGFFLSCGEQEPVSLVAVSRFFIAVASRVVELICSRHGASLVVARVVVHRAPNTGSVVVAHRLSCSHLWDLPGPGIEPVSCTGMWLSAA